MNTHTTEIGGVFPESAAMIAGPKAMAVSRYPHPLAESQPTSIAIPHPIKTSVKVPIHSARWTVDKDSAIVLNTEKDRNGWIVGDKATLSYNASEINALLNNNEEYWKDHI